jgi:succinate dehydrogenase flavin-adding protein (antitoxin of CptAB toxin-antitoxin module)
MRSIKQRNMNNSNKTSLIRRYNRHIAQLSDGISEMKAILSHGLTQDGKQMSQKKISEMRELLASDEARLKYFVEKKTSRSRSVLPDTASLAPA